MIKDHVNGPKNGLESVDLSTKENTPWTRLFLFSKISDKKCICPKIVETRSLLSPSLVRKYAPECYVIIGRINRAKPDKNNTIFMFK